MEKRQDHQVLANRLVNKFKTMIFLVCHYLVQFKAISGKINPIYTAILETMNTDQKYMFEASIAVKSKKLFSNIACEYETG